MYIGYVKWNGLWPKNMKGIPTWNTWSHFRHMILIWTHGIWSWYCCIKVKYMYWNVCKTDFPNLDRSKLGVICNLFYFDKSVARRSIASTSLDSTILTSHGDLTRATYRQSYVYIIWTTTLAMTSIACARLQNKLYACKSLCVYFSLNVIYL